MSPGNGWSGTSLLLILYSLAGIAKAQITYGLSDRMLCILDVQPIVEGRNHLSIIFCLMGLCKLREHITWDVQEPG